MCEFRSIDAKAIDIKLQFFPKGWKFAFHRHKRHPSSGPFIVVISPDGRVYSSIERAMNANYVRLYKVSVSMFYEYVGIERPTGDAFIVKSRIKQEPGEVKVRSGSAETLDLLHYHLIHFTTVRLRSPFELHPVLHRKEGEVPEQRVVL